MSPCAIYRCENLQFIEHKILTPKVEPWSSGESQAQLVWNATHPRFWLTNFHTAPDDQAQAFIGHESLTTASELTTNLPLVSSCGHTTSPWLLVPLEHLKWTQKHFTDFQSAQTLQNASKFLHIDSKFLQRCWKFLCLHSEMMRIISTITNLDSRCKLKIWTLNPNPNSNSISKLRTQNCCDGKIPKSSSRSSLRYRDDTVRTLLHYSSFIRITDSLTVQLVKLWR